MVAPIDRMSSSQKRILEVHQAFNKVLEKHFATKRGDKPTLGTVEYLRSLSEADLTLLAIFHIINTQAIIDVVKQRGLGPFVQEKTETIFEGAKDVTS